MENTEKLKVYKDALDFLLDEGEEKNYMLGLCYFITTAAKLVFCNNTYRAYYDGMELNYPEVFAHKPKRITDTEDYWFSCSKYGYNKRKAILRKAITELELLIKTP